MTSGSTAKAILGEGNLIYNFQAWTMPKNLLPISKKKSNCTTEEFHFDVSVFVLQMYVSQIDSFSLSLLTQTPSMFMVYVFIS